MFTEEISRYAGLIVCSLARGVELKMTGTLLQSKKKRFTGEPCSGVDGSERDSELLSISRLSAVCRKCSGHIKHKGGNVEFKSIEPLFKLIGEL